MIIVHAALDITSLSLLVSSVHLTLIMPYEYDGYDQVY
jgi:hypothetical protein